MTMIVQGWESGPPDGAGAARAWGHVDPLTGLPTRTVFLDRIGQALARARRYGEGAALVLLDLDHFGFVNDTIGPRQGDQVLQAVADRLRGLVRESDGIARDDGDRFALLLGGADAPSDLLSALRKIRRGLHAPHRWSRGVMELSATYGIALLNGRELEPERVLEAAGGALERAKRRGRGGYALAGVELETRVRTREREEHELEGALERGELVLHYQPRIDLRSGGVAGVEALVRWNHPQRGLLAPRHFLPLVEEMRLDARLFRWVLDRALVQADGWRREGRPRRMAVNVGRQALQHPDFADWVWNALADHDVNPAMLELELTENTPFEIFERRIAALDDLRQRGVRVSLDDFGVATASLSQLQRLPLDGLKIDRRFIARLEAGSAGDREMVRAIVAIGRSLSLTVVAEGIETEPQGRLLSELRCDEGQGYLYGHAVPGDHRSLAGSSAVAVA